MRLAPLRHTPPQAPDARTGPCTECLHCEAHRSTTLCVEDPARAGASMVVRNERCFGRLFVPVERSRLIFSQGRWRKPLSVLAEDILYFGARGLAMLAAVWAVLAALARFYPDVVSALLLAT